MVFRFYNPNPNKLIVGDCVIRAVSKLLDEDWDRTYARISLQGYKMKDMPSSNAVWGECLVDNAFRGSMPMFEILPTKLFSNLSIPVG